MKANFHTHTFRCRHAKGEDREYVEAAIAKGLSVLGFSDHSPYWFPGDYYSGYRMRPEQIEEYVSSVLSLREEYKKEITIYLGFEAEHYPAYFEKFMEMIEPYPYDYLILGQHFIHNEIGGTHMAKLFTEESFLSDYVSECIAGLKTGKFFYIAHPDVAYFSGDASFYEAQMRRLCEAAKELSVPLELNLLGLREGRNYPTPVFWKIAGEIGCDVILGCDAHRPHEMAREEDIVAAEQMIRENGLRLIEPMRPMRMKEPVIKA